MYLRERGSIILRWWSQFWKSIVEKKVVCLVVFLFIILVKLYPKFEFIFNLCFGKHHFIDVTLKKICVPRNILCGDIKSPIDWLIDLLMDWWIDSLKKKSINLFSPCRRIGKDLSNTFAKLEKLTICKLPSLNSYLVFYLCIIIIVYLPIFHIVFGLQWPKENRYLMTRQWRLRSSRISLNKLVNIYACSVCARVCMYFI